MIVARLRQAIEWLASWIREDPAAIALEIEQEESCPSPPASMTPAAIEAWVRENLDISNWIYLGPTEAGVRLASRVDPSPVFAVTWRMEGFSTAPDMHFRPSRSHLLDFEVDAVEQRFRLVRTTDFRFNDLRLPLEHKDLDASEWNPLAEDDDPFFDHVRDLCAQPLGEPKETPASRLQSDVDEWIARTLIPGQDVFSHSDSTGVVYVRPASVRRTRNGYGLSTRLEFFLPTGGRRSQLEAIELDGKRQRYRLMEVRPFAEHNLGGEALAVHEPRRWFSPSGDLRSEHFDRLREVARAVLAS